MSVDGAVEFDPLRVGAVAERKSLRLKEWRVAPRFEGALSAALPGLAPLELQLLSNRGLRDPQAVDEFLRSEFAEHIYDPALLKDAERAVERISAALRSGEKILVFGDFDGDGVTASVVLHKTFAFLGTAVDLYIPDREKESHGLRRESLAEIAARGVKLVITVDCGISNVDEVAYAATLGMDVIITDHHEVPPVLPAAVAVVNPKRADCPYPCKVLCGAGVAFKLAQLLLRRVGAERGKTLAECTAFEKWLLDVVAIGTIGDCVPLRSENRTLVKYGLIVLNKTRRPGIQKLLERAAGVARVGAPPAVLSSTDVAFRIVPRINAAGRLAHAQLAFDLLATGDLLEADALSLRLDKLNGKRQQLTETVSKEARDQILARGTDKSILWAIGGAAWPAGINGIVASKIMDEFHLPAIVMQRRADETVASGRSIPEFDITRAITQGKHLLTRFGGHPGACGFSLKNEHVEEFLALLERVAADQFAAGGVVAGPHLAIEAELGFADIGWDLVAQVERFQPFGQDNKEPLFVFRRMEVVDTRVMGKKNEHLKLFFAGAGDGRARVAAVGFYAAERLRPAVVGSMLDVVGRLRVNEWRGERNVEIELVDADFSIS